MEKDHCQHGECRQRKARIEKIDRLSRHPHSQFSHANNVAGIEVERGFEGAIVYLWAGEREKTLQLLSEVAKIPYGKFLGPRWDALRDDPRFERMVASLKPRPAS